MLYSSLCSDRQQTTPFPWTPCSSLLPLMIVLTVAVAPPRNSFSRAYSLGVTPEMLDGLHDGFIEEDFG